ncbi:cytochrome b561 [Aliidongia dinghuensis]|uniref:Cytochrome b561 n=1 Tax=Aliidongia dinghuensis TaxID=1867774 RepID=A0A8J2Z068_9PROT|nr:YqaA family protein [Aliidongia dinghuensis]GGF38240.1 cytochrome b561 [Aliidongia dinghuensis]
MLRRLYDWLLLQAGKPNATWVMAAISFAESSFFPLPPDVLMIPMMIAERRKAFWLAAVATAASVLGAYVGYAIGFYLFASVGERILAFYGAMDTFEALRQKFLQYGVEIIVLKGMTPIPFKLVTIASGLARFDLGLFTVACVVSRSIRFFLLALILFFVGEQARTFIEKRLMLVTTVSAAMLVCGFVLVKYVHFS